MARNYESMIGRLRALSKQLGGQFGELNRQVRGAVASLLSDAVSQFARDVLFRAMLGQGVPSLPRRVHAREQDYDPWSDAEDYEPDEEPVCLGSAPGESADAPRESNSPESKRLISQLFRALSELAQLLPGWMLTGRVAEILANRGPLSRFARALILEARSLVVVSAILARAEKPLGLPADSTRP